MESSFQILKVLSIGAYLAAFVVYLTYFLKGTSKSAIFATPALIVALLVHLLYLFVISLYHRHVPITNIGEAMTTTVFCLAGIYYFIEMSTREKNLGAFVLPLALIFQFLSALSIHQMKPIDPVLETGAFAFHAVTNIVAYSGFFLGFIFSLLYVLLIRQIKRKNTGQLFRRLPSLGILDTMSLHSVTFGFALFTFGLVSGSFLSKSVWGVYFNFELKTILAVVIWIVYLGYLLTRKIEGWSRNRSAAYAIIAFSLVLFNFVVASYFSPSHSF